MTFEEMMNQQIKKQMLQHIVKCGGYKLSDNKRYLPEYKKEYYILYEEDISNLLCGANTIITKN